MAQADTIFALSSGKPPSGVAVVRISGPGVADALDALGCAGIEPRKAVLRNLIDSDSKGLIDRGLVLFFPAPNSFTGEDVAELQVHGGRAVVEAVLDALSRLDRLRPAGPGEFTRRAFESGRMDLAEVEGLADLIAAETDRQRAQALRQMGGGLSEKCRQWRETLLRSRARIEAGFDFSDEDDVPDDVAASVVDEARRLRVELVAYLAGGRAGEVIRDGFRIALMGAPNAGKSSLLNFLARRDVAIVTEHAGTTRDLIEVRLDIDGYYVVLTDTAGLREVDSPVEQEGIRRARETGSESDLVLWLEEPGAPLEARSVPKEFDPARVWTVLTKQDLVGDLANTEIDSKTQRFRISVRNGYGTDALIEALAEEIRVRSGAQEDILITRHRHRRDIEEAVDCLDAIGNRSQPLELTAEHLRRAGDHIGRIVGAIDVEDLLDHIFREFCIGK